MGLHFHELGNLVFLPIGHAIFLYTQWKSLNEIVDCDIGIKSDTFLTSNLFA
jgi:hypothetical protein